MIFPPFPHVSPIPGSQTYPPIEDLLPHAQPMVFLDNILDHDDDWILCGFTLQPGMPFIRNGEASTIILIEHMAQCIAAYTGYRSFRIGTPPQLGLLLACSHLELTRPRIAVGTSLTVKAKRIWGETTAGKFDCSVRLDEQTIATASLSVALLDHRKLTP